MVKVKRNYRKHGPKPLKGHPRQKGKRKDITKKCLTNSKGQLKKWLKAANGQIYVPKRLKHHNKDGSIRRVTAAQRAHRAAFGRASKQGILKTIGRKDDFMPGLEAPGTPFLPNRPVEKMGMPISLASNKDSYMAGLGDESKKRSRSSVVTKKSKARTEKIGKRLVVEYDKWGRPIGII